VDDGVFADEMVGEDFKAKLSLAFALLIEDDGDMGMEAIDALVLLSFRMTGLTAVLLLLLLSCGGMRNDDREEELLFSFSLFALLLWGLLLSTLMLFVGWTAASCRCGGCLFLRGYGPTSLRLGFGLLFVDFVDVGESVVSGVPVAVVVAVLAGGGLFMLSCRCCVKAILCDVFVERVRR